MLSQAFITPKKLIYRFVFSFFHLVYHSSLSVISPPTPSIIFFSFLFNFSLISLSLPFYISFFFFFSLYCLFLSLFVALSAPTYSYLKIFISPLVISFNISLCLSLFISFLSYFHISFSSWLVSTYHYFFIFPLSLFSLSFSLSLIFLFINCYFTSLYFLSQLFISFFLFA